MHFVCLFCLRTQDFSDPKTFLRSRKKKGAPVRNVMAFCLETVSGLATVGLVSCLLVHGGFSGLLLFHNDTEPALTRVYGGRPVLLTSFS